MSDHSVTSGKRFAALIAASLLATIPNAGAEDAACPNEEVLRPSNSDLQSVLETHAAWVSNEGWADSTIPGRAILCFAWMDSVELEGVDLTRADLRAHLARSNLREAKLNGADLRGANLNGAKLVSTELVGADLRGAGLSGAVLNGAHLRGANLGRVILSKAVLLHADLTGAELQQANLSGTDFGGANLTGADLSEAWLMDTRLADAFLTGANFAKSTLAQADFDDIRLIGAKGLSDIVVTDPTRVATLRNIAKASGLRREDRALTSALRKFSLEHEPSMTQFLERWVMGGQLTDFGAEPSRSLVLMFVLIAVFAVVYIQPVAVFDSKPSGAAGLFKVCPKERIANDGTNLQLTSTAKVERLQARGFAALGWAAYFSLLSAFHIGWRELNIGSWVIRLQRHEFVLRPTGWVRVVSGLQSLVSVYLVALWALTYFGRPFE